MGTFCHYLKDNKGTTCPQRLCFVDTETLMTHPEPDQTLHKLKLGWACMLELATSSHRQKESWLYFTEIGDFWRWLFGFFRNKTRMVLLAHQLAIDFVVLQGFTALDSRGFTMSAPYFSGQTNIIKFKAPGRKLLALDTGNWFKGTVASLGKIAGQVKGSVDFDSVSMDDLSIYCFRDVEILVDAYKIWLKFISDHDLGTWGITLPSQAFNAFRHRFMKHKILIHAQPSIIDLERKAYQGGRTECFYLGKRTDGPFYMLDVNSLYPSVMLGTSVPIRKKFILRYPRNREVKTYLKKYAAIATVEINTKEPAYPLRDKNVLLWPVGRFVTTLCTPELEYAFSQGHVTDVKKIILYDRAKIFADYVGFFYALRKRYRQEQNHAFDQITKLFMNSLYGKFGQRCETWSECENEFGLPPGEHYELDVQTGERLRYLIMENQAWTISKGGESMNAFTAIAAHVTSAARVRLHKLITKAGERHIFYCDTDSLLVDKVGLKNLDSEIDKLELGKLKLEYITPWFDIRGPKDYSTDRFHKIKGIRKNAEQISPCVFKQERWPGFRSLLAEGNTTEYVVRKITKRIRRYYKKGWKDDDNFVNPFIYPFNLVG